MVDPDHLPVEVQNQEAKQRRGRLNVFFGKLGSVVDDLIRRSGEIDIHVIRGRAADESTSAPAASASTHPRDTRGYVIALIIIAVTTALGWPLYHKLRVSNENILMLYLLGVLWVATHHSRRAAIFASVLSVAAYDLVFVPPYYTFAVSERQYVVTFAVMLLTALVISTLTHRVREQAEAARDRERRTAALFAFSRDLAVARTADEIAAATVGHVGDALGRKTILLLADADRRLMTKGDPPNGSLSEKELGVAQWSFEHDQVAGRGTNTLPAAEGSYLPLRASRGVIGVLGLLGDSNAVWPVGKRQLAEAFASQTALAIERTTLAEEARVAWERVEAEFLRNTLLSGVSHELRTPLAAITGAASALVENGNQLQPEARRELLDSVIGAAERMERLINNLLDMTRLEAGGLVLKREWQPLQEVIGSALRALDHRLHGRAVTTDLPADLPLVNVDAVAIEQVLANLLDNALEYTPPGITIEIAARANGQEVTVEVADRGPGLPPGTERRVFEKFFRAGAGEPGRGIGLGLAISRGIVEAHGGRINAANRTGGGAVFTFTLPRTAEPPPIDATT
jgi:two-component system sensor histidine kinase KdpD